MREVALLGAFLEKKIFDFAVGLRCNIWSAVPGDGMLEIQSFHIAKRIGYPLLLRASIPRFNYFKLDQVVFANPILNHHWLLLL